MPAAERAPRTQQQRRDETRRALLDAAVESLIARGVAGTTTLEVQKRAGVSRGALLHHFPSKAELVAATVKHLAHMRGRELKERAASLPEGEARFDAVFDLLWQSFTGPMVHVAMELRAAARTDRELRRALVPVERELHFSILAQYRALFGPELAARPGFDRAFEMTLALMTGAAMSSLLHGEHAARFEQLVTTWKPVFHTLLERTL